MEQDIFLQKYFKTIQCLYQTKNTLNIFNGHDQTCSLKSNGMPEECTEKITKSNNLFAPTFLNLYILPDVDFTGHCLINNNISVFKKVKHIYISEIIIQRSRYLNTDFTLGNSLFGSVKLTKNTDPNKYVNTGYVTRFDLHSQFSLPDGSMEKNVTTVGADMSPSVHFVNKGKVILILVEGPTQGLDDTTLIAEAKCPINLT